MKKRTASPLNSQRGQMTVEVILLAVLFTALALLIGRYFKDEQIIQDAVQTPWNNKFAGMIENGVWGGAEETRELHPNLLSRHSSLKGDSVQ